MWAAADNQPQIVAALLEAGADVERAREGASGAAAAAAGAPTRRSSRRTATFPKGGFTALHVRRAVRAPATRRRVLADAGADLEAADPDGITPLMMAIINGHYDVAAVLVTQGRRRRTRVDRSGRGAAVSSPWT